MELNLGRIFYYLLCFEVKFKGIFGEYVTTRTNKNAIRIKNYRSSECWDIWVKWYHLVVCNKQRIMFVFFLAMTIYELQVKSLPTRAQNFENCTSTTASIGVD
jgi:hypothetical protein